MLAPHRSLTPWFTLLKRFQGGQGSIPFSEMESQVIDVLELALTNAVNSALSEHCPRPLAFVRPRNRTQEELNHATKSAGRTLTIATVHAHHRLHSS